MKKHEETIELVDKQVKELESMLPQANKDQKSQLYVRIAELEKTKMKLVFDQER